MSLYSVSNEGFRMVEVIPFSSLTGQTLTNVVVYENFIDFDTADGKTYSLYHKYDNTLASEVTTSGDPSVILDSPITVAKVIDYTDPMRDLVPNTSRPRKEPSYTYHYFQLSTAHADFVIEFFVASDSYHGEHSENVDFAYIERKSEFYYEEVCFV